MKKIFSLTAGLKLFISFLFSVLVFQLSFAQKSDQSGVLGSEKPERTQAVYLDCNIPRPQPNCNHILNNTFSRSQYYNPSDPVHNANPFNILNDPANPVLSLIPEWRASHGTPQAFDGINTYTNDPLPFFGAGGYARMGCFFQIPNWPEPWGGEGIIQKIPVLRTGNQYVLSFFKKIDSYNIGFVPDHFRIVLAHCSLSESFYPLDQLTFVTPTVPAPPDAQVVYCEQNFSNTNWQQVVVSFTANSNYDMIWVYPEINPTIPQSVALALFSFPQLVNMITAGPPPNPTPGNCVVTIGPTTPNCGVKNAVFTWRRPDGLLIPATSNQQIQVDASNPVNVGNWTLTMTIPGVTTTNNICSNQGPISASVYVPSCTGITASWPKIYEAIEATGVRIDNNGNMFANIMMQDMTNHINHAGPTISGLADAVVQYNTTTSVTNWVKAGAYTGLPFGGNTINLFDYTGTNFYLNSSSGLTIAGPNVPANVRLIAEDNGGFIALDGYNLKSYDNSGNLVSTVPIATISGYYLDPYRTSLAIYHSSNHRLFVCLSYYNGSVDIYRIGVYDFNATSTYALAAVNTPSNNQVHGPLVQVNNAEKIFVYDPVNQILEEYHWTATTPYYTALTISNFSNNSLEELIPFHHLVEDRILTRGSSYYYCINTGSSPFTATKIAYTAPSGGGPLFDRYVFEGNNVFITGQYQATGLTIGVQSFPLLGSNSVFVTKFDLNEFNRPSQQGSFAKGGDTNSYNSSRIEPYNLIDQLQLFPNPVKQTLTVTLTQTANKGNSLFFISITNTAGEKLLTTFSNKYNTVLDVLKLKPGLYYVSITTDKGNIITKAFLKE